MKQKILFILFITFILFTVPVKSEYAIDDQDYDYVYSIFNASFFSVADVEINNSLEVGNNIDAGGNITSQEEVKAFRFRYLNGNNKSYTKVGDVDFIGTERTIVFGNNEPELNEGEIVFLLYVQENRTIIWGQFGKNNSAGGLGNSWMIIPNTLGIDNFSNDGKVNFNNLSSCIEVCDFYDQICRIKCDTEGYGASLLVQGGIQIFRQLFVGEGIRSEGAADFILNGNDFNAFNGSIHTSIPVNFQSGFSIGESFTIASENFEGGLGSFKNYEGNIFDWITNSNVLCDSGQCAIAQGNGGTVIMETNQSTIDKNNTGILFSYALTNLIGSDTFNIYANNNTGSGDELVFTDNGVVGVTEVFIELDDFGNFSNASVVTIKIECDTTQTTRFCYFDTFSMNGTITRDTTQNVSGFDSEICFSDGVRGADGNCSRGIFYSASEDVIKFFGSVNITASGGGISGTGSANSVAKWAASTSLTNSLITDDGALVTIPDLFVSNSPVNCSDDFYMKGTSMSSSTCSKVSNTSAWNQSQDTISTGHDVGIGTATPVKTVDIVGSLNVTDGINTSYFTVANAPVECSSGYAMTFWNGSASVCVGVNGTLNSIAWSKDGSNIYLTDIGDKVGIGTTTPTQKLDVRGGVNISKDLTAGNLTLIEDGIISLSDYENILVDNRMALTSEIINFSDCGGGTCSTVLSIDSSTSPTYYSPFGHIFRGNDEGGILSIYGNISSYVFYDYSFEFQNTKGYLINATLAINELNSDYTFHVGGTANINDTLYVNDSQVLINGSINVTENLTADELTIGLGANSDWRFLPVPVGDILGLQQQKSGAQARVWLMSKDGDGTDNTLIDIFVVGTPTNLTGQKRVSFGYASVRQEMLIQSIDYPINIRAGANEQIYLLNDGTTQFNAGDISITAGDLTITNGGLTMTGTDKLKLEQTLIYFDGTNLIFQTNDTSRYYPNAIAWFSSNISANDYITRTSVFDSLSGNALDLIKDSDDYLDLNGEIDHSKFYGYTTYKVTDKSKPEIEYYEVENCTSNDETFEEVCFNETKERIIYPHQKIEEGVSLNKEIDVLRQGVYDLNKKVETLEQENQKLKECILSSKEFSEYKICIQN